MIGAGFYFPAVVATLATLGVLSAFRWIEGHLPSEFYAHHWLTFSRNAAMSESELRSLIESFGFSIANLSYSLTEQGQRFEYRMVIRTTRRENLERLAEKLRTQPEVLEFCISPTGD